MTNDSMKKSKLQAHQLLKHPGSVGKECSYLNYARMHEKPLEFCVNKANESSIKTLRASYAVSELVGC